MNTVTSDNPLQQPDTDNDANDDVVRCAYSCALSAGVESMTHCAPPVDDAVAANGPPCAAFRGWACAELRHHGSAEEDGKNATEK